MDDLVKFARKNIKATFIACDFSVKRVVTLGVVPYRNQWFVNCMLHLAELYIGSSIRYKYTLVGNYFIKGNIIKIIFL